MFGNRPRPKGLYDPALRNNWLVVIFAAQLGSILFAAYLARPLGWFHTAFLAPLGFFLLWRLVAELRKP